MEDAFVGIDVACAKRKRLPICICTMSEGRLVPIPLRLKSSHRPPRGEGNRGALDDDKVQEFARRTIGFLQEIERVYGVRICRVAIDAPSAPKREGLARRVAEVAMDDMRISCFATPSAEEFGTIRDKARLHLQEGGGESTIPHANQLWMLVGFALFAVLRKRYECIEVFPQAIVHRLGVSSQHKSTTDGLGKQLEAVARHTGWPTAGESLAALCFGSQHDRLDAYLSAWVASLPLGERRACGDPDADDVIWIPEVGGDRTDISKPSPGQIVLSS